MIKFSELGIKPVVNHFTGDKVKLSKILNKEIIVTDFNVKPSQFKGSVLQLQIEIDSKKHVVFTGSTVLIDQIDKVPKASFPFKTTIVEENEHYEFT